MNLGAIGSFVKSLFYPDHYAWALETRRGIGLSYIFAANLFLIYGYLATLCFSVGLSGTQEIIDINFKNLSDEFPELLLLTTLGIDAKILFFAALPLIFVFILTIILHFYALFNAIFLAAPMNLLSGGNSDFAAMLRVSSYLVVAVTFVSGVLLYLFPSLLDSATMLTLVLLVIYNIMAVIYPNVLS